MAATIRSRVARATAGLAVLASVATMLVGASATPTGAASSTGIESWETAVIDLPNGAIAYDETRDQVLVAVAPTVPTLGNHLVELDPHDGTIGRSVAVGADPRAIGVSDDGTRAYVGGVGSAFISEVDLATFTIVRKIYLGVNQYLGSMYVEDIEVQPGDASVIAVSIQLPGFSPRHGGVAIFDDGVRRETATPGHTGANRIEWSDDPATLYGINNESSGQHFFVLTVDAQGVTAAKPDIEGFGRDIAYGDGELVGVSGKALAVPELTDAGTYTLENSYGRVALDTEHDVAYFLEDDTLTSHSTTTKLETATRTVPSIEATTLLDAGSSLVAAGETGVLLLGEDVTATGFVPPATPDSVLRNLGNTSTAVSVAQLAGAPDGQHVYGVVRKGAPQLAGRVVEISTIDGRITRSVAVGSDPHRIEVSADGSTLMVGHVAATKLTEVAVADMTVRRTIALGAGHWAEDIAARPGTAATFAVVLVNGCCSPALEGQVLVRNGVVLPDRGPDHTGATTVTFADDPDVLYGSNGGTTDFGFYTLAVGPTGLTPVSDVRGLTQGFYAELTATDGVVYSSRGYVIDPTIPSVEGRFPVGQVAVFPDADRLFTVDDSTITELDLDTLSAVGEVGLTQIPTLDHVRDAVAVGSNLAIATNAGTVLILPIGTSAAESWVQAAYEDFLGREPTSQELAATVARIASGTPRSTIARELATSPEWISHLVDGFYADTLGREPTSDELAYWAEELATGRRTVARVAASFYASDEAFSNAGGTNADWIEDLYLDLLGREATGDDITYWSGQVAARGRGWVALQLYQSLESRRARVTTLYEALLGRAPDAAGRDYWAGRLTVEGDIALARSLASSAEYLARARTRFP